MSASIPINAPSTDEFLALMARVEALEQAEPPSGGGCECEPDNFEFFDVLPIWQHPGVGAAGPVSQAAYLPPGAAASSSTVWWYGGRTNLYLKMATLLIDWNPNALPWPHHAAINVYHADSGFQNKQQLLYIPGEVGSPTTAGGDLTTALRNFCDNNITKLIGIEVHGGGSLAPLIYKAVIERHWMRYPPA